ncbi:hypothetical protein C1I92_21310 [Jiangella anatolica]|uniref:SpaA-like prealbumin fold domain-containing protein n=1 Tax=Jiangella anatolica TaxID=2670374 RepID=A0A2W2C0B5_9ACTN|nr:hypothetical protein C1I92_21310 [Jiangella anatolica]
MLMLVAGSMTAAGTGALANESGNELVGGFEIDGNFYEGFDNTTTATGPDGDPIDWGSDDIYPADVDVVEDIIGGEDPSIYDQGSKENDPDSWDDASSAGAPSKGDLGNVYVHDRTFEGDQYVFVGFERSTDRGTTAWALELNQLPNVLNANGTPVPDRTDGDLRITLVNHGDGTFEVRDVERWADGAWESTGTEDDVVAAVNDSTINLPGGRTRAAEQFVEFGFNLSDLLDDEDCTFTGFETLNLRSRAAISESSELKDYATGAIDIPARCGEITIEKRDPDGELLGGATFTIEPNPIPGAADPASLTITDNDANDADPADGVITIDPAEPGDYTITEATPPPGYIQDGEPQDVTLEDFGSVTVTFVNGLGSLAWSKLDAESGDAVCCATFTVEGTAGAAVGVSLTVVDNRENDADPADGAILVEGLLTGTYTVTETVPPTGYDLPADPVRDGLVIDSDTPDLVIEDAFEDPRLLSELTVLKLDADTQEPLAGATFELYLDDGDGDQEAPDGDTLIGDCTTGDDGTCTIGDLGWGTYYWYEAAAPTGYELPADRFSGMTTIDRDNAGSELPVSTLTDRQVRSSIAIVKTDATTEDALAGATFVVRRDDGDGVFEDSDPIVDPPGEVVTDATGTVTVGGLLFGDYWVEETGAPTGYELPDPAFQGPFTIGPDNAGDTVTVTFEDPQLLTDLSVLKLDGGSDTAAPLAGATFELYLDDPADGVMDAPDGDTLVGDCTTGADGTCTVTGLGFGSYYWLETAAPPGYDLPDDPYSAFVNVTAENAGTELEPLTFFNPRKPGELAVLKLDDSDDAPLAGAQFELHEDDADGPIVGSCTTGDDGTCSVGDLDFGTYVWVEIAAPQGYDLPADPVSDPIVVNESTVGQEPTPFEFRDPRLLSELSVLKVDAFDGTPLAGAEFELHEDDASGDVVGSCTTGDDGTCSVGDLDFGTYVWVEITAPQGYDLPADPVSDPIVIDASNAGGDITQVVMHDPRLLSELSVHKVAEDTGESLPGAVFDLVLADGDIVVGTCTTGDDGTCTIENLDFGDYYWVEIAAPEGYLLPDDVTSDIVSITAENAGTVIAAVTFVDPPVEEPPTPTPTPTPTTPAPSPTPSPSPPPDEPDLPDTGVGGPVGLAVLVATVGLAVGAALRWRYRRGF